MENCQIKICFDESDKNTSLRNNQTLQNYLGDSVGNFVYNFLKKR